MKDIAKHHSQQKLINVGNWLYRSHLTDGYYGIFERDGRQVKRSLKTTDRELAKRRVEELRRKVERLTASSGAGLSQATTRAALPPRLQKHPALKNLRHPPVHPITPR